MSGFRVRFRVRIQGHDSGLGFRVRIQCQDSGSGIRVRIQGWDLGSGFRVRFQGRDSGSNLGSIFWLSFRVCFLVKGLKYYISVIFGKIQLLILEGNPIANFKGGG